MAYFSITRKLRKNFIKLLEVAILSFLACLSPKFVCGLMVRHDLRTAILDHVMNDPKEPLISSSWSSVKAKHSCSAI